MNSQNGFNLRNKRLNANSLTENEKLWLANQIVSKKQKSSQLALKYGLKQRTLNDWANKVRNGIKIHESGGRPPIIAPKFLSEMTSELTDQKYQKSTKEFDEMMAKYKSQTAKDYGRPNYNGIKKIDRRTKGRYEAKMNIKTANAEPTTNAREVACSDIFNFVSMAAMNQLLSQLTVPELTMNADATQFAVGCDKGDKVEVKYIGDVEGPMKASEESTGNAGTNLIFIKYMLIMTAAGTVAPPIYIVADGNMNEGDFDWYKVPGLARERERRRLAEEAKEAAAAKKVASAAKRAENAEKKRKNAADKAENPKPAKKAKK